MEVQLPNLRPYIEALDDNEFKLAKEEPPKLELKQLPSHLRYAFLSDRDIYLVIVSASLSGVEEEKLLKVLHKRLLGGRSLI